MERSTTARRESQYWRVLNQPKLLAGAEFSLAVFNITIGLCFIVATKMWQVLIVTIILHMILRAVSKHDALLRKIYLRYALQGDAYDPWPKVSQKRNTRPHGFGKEMLC